MALEGLVGLPVSYLVLILIASGARFMLAKNAPDFKLLLGSILWGLFVVLGTYDLMLAVAFNEEAQKVNKGMVTALVAIGAFLAKDILEILIKLFEQIKVDPLALLRDLLNNYKPGSKDKRDDT